MREYDLVIVGASFAGLACARTAAMRGLRVAVLERKDDPGEGVRTTGILVKEAIEETDIPVGLTRMIREVRVHAPGGRSVDLSSPGYFFLATDTP
ncbi:MAG: FAD-dependent oxidoreductase, partial [Alphaproteobacteria bacterium]